MICKSLALGYDLAVCCLVWFRSILGRFNFQTMSTCPDDPYEYIIELKYV